MPTKKAVHVENTLVTHAPVESCSFETSRTFHRRRSQKVQGENADSRIARSLGPSSFRFVHRCIREYPTPRSGQSVTLGQWLWTPTVKPTEKNTGWGDLAHAERILILP